jgi:integrase
MTTPRKEPNRQKMTQSGLDRLKPPASGRVEYWDTQLPGFGLRVSHTGRKTWVAMYRVHGRLVRETIATMALIPNVADARERARISMRKAQAGSNPVEERRRTKAEIDLRFEQAAAAEVASQRDAMENVITDFMQRFMLRGRRSHSQRYIAEVQRNFDNHVLPRWRGRNIKSIVRREVNDLLDSIVDEGKPIAANRTLAAIRKLFNWAITRGILDTSPVAMIEPPSAEELRERALKPDEIRALWKATDALGYPFGSYFRLLLATGQRRTEVATMRWGDIDDGLWTIPAGMTKSKRAHAVPLSPLALEIITGCPRTASPYVFSTRAKRPISGYSKAKRELDTKLADHGDMQPWRIHDLRRTAATRMAEKAKVSRFVIARVLNHADSGVTAGYDQHDYLPEKRDALVKWGDYISDLTRRDESVSLGSGGFGL